MRESIKNYVRLVEECLDLAEPIYEFGALQVEGQEGFADLRPFFGGKEYVGCDMREGPGVDRVANLHDLDLPSESGGSALCLDTLEHVEHPHEAMRQIHRVLKPGGVAVISSVMNFPIHSHPYDYWRFTPEGFKSILAPFESIFVEYAGEEIFPHTVVGVGVKARFSFAELEPLVAQWRRDQDPVQPSTGRRLVKSLIPPALVQLKRRLVG